MNIVYGGAFNPITIAHESIISRLLTEYLPNNLIIIPVGSHYEKSGLVTIKSRVEMIKLAVKSEKVIVSEIEEKTPFLGTYRTLKELNETYQNLWYVLGADNLEKFSKWLNFDQLIAEFSFIIINRNNSHTFEKVGKQFPTLKFKFLDVDFPGSSTKFRKGIKNKSELVSENVLKYIETNSLYE